MEVLGGVPLFPVGLGDADRLAMDLDEVLGRHLVDCGER